MHYRCSCLPGGGICCDQLMLNKPLDERLQWYLTCSGSVFSVKKYILWRSGHSIYFYGTSLVSLQLVLCSVVPDFVPFLFMYLGPNLATGSVQTDLDSCGAWLSSWDSGWLRVSFWRSDCGPEREFLFYSPGYLLLICENYPAERYCLWVSCTSTAAAFRHRVLGMLSDIVKIFLLCHMPKTSCLPWLLCYVFTFRGFLRQMEGITRVSSHWGIGLNSDFQVRVIVGNLLRSFFRILVDLGFVHCTRNTTI